MKEIKDFDADFGYWQVRRGHQYLSGFSHSDIAV